MQCQNAETILTKWYLTKAKILKNAIYWRQQEYSNDAIYWRKQRCSDKCYLQKKGLKQRNVQRQNADFNSSYKMKSNQSKDLKYYLLKIQQKYSNNAIYWRKERCSNKWHWYARKGWNQHQYAMSSQFLQYDILPKSQDLKINAIFWRQQKYSNNAIYWRNERLQ